MARLARTGLVGLVVAFSGAACALSMGGLVVEQLGGADGSTGTEPSEGGLDQPETCPADNTVCASGCVDPRSDPDNCGGCGKACTQGQACIDSACSVLCGVGTTKCQNACVDTQTDPSNCGKCGNACAQGQVCAAGQCQSTCPPGLARCTRPNPDGGTPAEYCADLSKDRNDCGMCGKACTASETCTASACTPLCATGSVPANQFQNKMVGCTGKVTFANRATLCPPGVPVCSVAQYRANRGNAAPTYNYWTNDDLRGKGTDKNCAVSVGAAGGYNSCNGNYPMRVCAGYTDPLGNQCNGTRCGYQATQPNEFFGGCTNNLTAGTLCCAP